MDLIGKKIEGFPYPEKYCPYCERELQLEAAVHSAEMPAHFKAVYVCLNGECGAYDEDARKCYVRVYYSSQDAHKAFEAYRIWMPTSKKN